MNKNEAIELFGSRAKTAKALGVTRAAVSKWPDRLSAAVSDRVIAAAVRKGIELPSDMLGLFANKSRNTKQHRRQHSGQPIDTRHNHESTTDRQT